MIQFWSLSIISMMQVLSLESHDLGCVVVCARSAVHVAHQHAAPLFHEVCVCVHLSSGVCMRADTRSLTHHILTAWFVGGNSARWAPSAERRRGFVKCSPVASCVHCGKVAVAEAGTGVGSTGSRSISKALWPCLKYRTATPLRCACRVSVCVSCFLELNTLCACVLCEC